MDVTDYVLSHIAEILPDINARVTPYVIKQSSNSYSFSVKNSHDEEAPNFLLGITNIEAESNANSVTVRINFSLSKPESGIPTQCAVVSQNTNGGWNSINNDTINNIFTLFIPHFTKYESKLKAAVA